VRVHPHTRRVLQTANDFYGASKGVFDIRASLPHPSFAALSLRERGGVRRSLPPIEFRGSRVRKTGPWTFDLGGIAKGYAVDCAVATIKRLSRGKLAYGVVNAGGDLRRWGKEVVPVAVATSAVRTPETSERLSPAVHLKMPDGRPLTEPRAATVFAGRCIWSDALTKVMLLASPRITDQCFQRYGAYGMVVA